MGQPRPLLSFIFGLFKHTPLQFFTTKIIEKMSIQYTVLGFEPTTYGPRTSSHNHLTRTPALMALNLQQKLFYSFGPRPQHRAIHFSPKSGSRGLAPSLNFFCRLKFSFMFFQFLNMQRDGFEGKREY